MSIKHYVDQGTEPWYRLRMGIPTASEFHRIITPKKWGPSSQQRGYIYELVAERMLNEPKHNWIDHGRTPAIEWGKLHEATAADEFAYGYDLKLEPIGFVTTDDGRLGCSPDRLIVGSNHSVEIKCPQAHVHMGYLLDGVGDDYKAQVQGQLYVGGFEAVHFWSWHKDMPPKHYINTRNEAAISIMAEILEHFLAELDHETERARGFGPYAAKVYAEKAVAEREAYLQ